ncbi:MAG: metallophosphoesterase [Verrucomicrobia bacterium]|nr:metallophosphoesterase [Verrucomicrobiota bacterium]
MTLSRLRIVLQLGVLAGLWLLANGVRAAEASPTHAGRFIALGDVHFDPFAGFTRAQFAELLNTPVEAWTNQFRIQPAPTFGADAPYSLIESSLDDARARLPDPDWILVPGDFLAHGWPAKYDQLAPRTRTEDPATYRRFTHQVMQFLAGRLRARFPSTPIFSVLGNEDSDCGDYLLTPQSSFLRDCVDDWKSLVFPKGTEGREQRRFRETLARGGYYSVRLPQLRRHRLIALNTVFFAPQYSNACGDSTSTPARDQLHWLEAELQSAERAGETVWLLMHLPPGIDSYATLKAGGWPQPLWQPELTAWFLQLLARHEKRIQFGFAGHTHMDDFRLVHLGPRPVLVTKIVPGVSPIFGNNPGYHLVTYDRRSGRILDYQTAGYRLNGPEPRVWALEYTFSQAYPGSRLEPESLESLGRQVIPGTAVGAIYRQWYSVAGQPTPIPVEALGCAFLSTTVGAYQVCAPALAPPP